MKRDRVGFVAEERGADEAVCGTGEACHVHLQPKDGGEG